MQTKSLQQPLDESVLLLGRRWALPILVSDQKGIDESLMLLGRKWAFPVFLELLSGRNRFNTLLAAIPGINARTLSARLYDYQESGLIRRVSVDADPPRVQYVLTPKGEEMRRVVTEIASFSLKWHAAPVSKDE